MGKVGEAEKSGMYYPTHLHIHTCFGHDASMNGHLYEASRMGMKTIWFTDHDYRMGKRKYSIEGFDFEGDSLIKEHEKNKDIQYGWKKEGLPNPAKIKFTLTEEKVYRGNKSLKVNIEADNSRKDWQNSKIIFFATGKGYQYSLLSQVKLKFAFFTEKILGSDTRIIFDVQMSQHPPEHKKAGLKYVIGNTKGLENKYNKVIPLNIEVSKWNSLLLDLSRDAELHALGGLDNSFGTLSIIVESKSPKISTFYIDDFRIISKLSFEDVRAEQAKLAKLLGKKYNIIPFVGTEISKAGEHKNCFSTHVPIINYERNNYNVSHSDAVNWVKKYKGIFAVNHPFGLWKNKASTVEDRKASIEEVAKIHISNKCDGASMIEVGFPEGKYGFSVEEHLILWDKLSEKGIFITAYGSSDNHSNDKNWWTGNNFANWIYAEKLKEEKFIESMKSGKLFTGDPAIFKGELSFQTKDGYSMGQVVKVNKCEYCIQFKINKLKPKSLVRWVVDGMETKSDKTDQEQYLGEYILKTKKDIHFVRIEVYEETSRCIILTNPIYFVKSDEIEIPKERLTHRI